MRSISTGLSSVGLDWAKNDYSGWSTHETDTAATPEDNILTMGILSIWLLTLKIMMMGMRRNTIKLEGVQDGLSYHYDEAPPTCDYMGSLHRPIR